MENAKHYLQEIFRKKINFQSLQFPEISLKQDSKRFITKVRES